MKFGVALAGAALALLGATAAQAQITINLGAPTTLPSGALEYGGTFINTSSSPVEIDGANINPSNGVQFFDALEGSYSDGTNDPNLSSLPINLLGNSQYNDNDLFELIVPAGTPTTSLTYTLSNAAGTVLGSTTFTVGGSAVPEPGSVALLMGGLVSGGMFVSRRRRK